MSDRRIFLAVVLFLGGTLMLSVGGIVLLAAYERQVPGILENIAVGCLTGLAGLLARGPSSDHPQAVTVRQPTGEPVPTVEVAGA